MNKKEEVLSIITVGFGLGLAVYFGLMEEVMKALEYFMYGIIVIVAIGGIGMYTSNWLTYKLYRTEEYYDYKRKLERVDWNFMVKNAKRVNEVMKEVLFERGIELKDDEFYRIEFLDDGIMIYEEYESRGMKVMGVQAPEALKERIELYKKW